MNFKMIHSLTPKMRMFFGVINLTTGSIIFMVPNSEPFTHLFQQVVATFFIFASALFFSTHVCNVVGEMIVVVLFSGRGRTAYLEAQHFIKKKDFDGAIHIYKTELKYNPKSFDAYSGLLEMFTIYKSNSDMAKYYLAQSQESLMNPKQKQSLRELYSTLKLKVKERRHALHKLKTK